MREWDRNGKGELNRQEWRQAVRNSLGLKANNADIDALFDAFDADSGGTLDLQELRPCLKALQDAYLAGVDVVNAQLALATAASERADEFREAAEAVKAVEEEEAKITAFEHGQPLPVLVGLALYQRKLRVEALSKTWRGIKNGCERAAVARSRSDHTHGLSLTHPSPFSDLSLTRDAELVSRYSPRRSLLPPVARGRRERSQITSRDPRRRAHGMVRHVARRRHQSFPVEAWRYACQPLNPS